MIYTLYYRTKENLFSSLNKIPYENTAKLNRCRYWSDLRIELAKLGCTPEQIWMVMEEFTIIAPADNREPMHLVLKDCSDQIDFNFEDGTGLTVLKYTLKKIIHQKPKPYE